MTSPATQKQYWPDQMWSHATRTRTQCHIQRHNGMPQCLTPGIVLIDSQHTTCERTLARWALQVREGGWSKGNGPTRLGHTGWRRKVPTRWSLEEWNDGKDAIKMATCYEYTYLRRYPSDLDINDYLMCNKNKNITTAKYCEYVQSVGARYNTSWLPLYPWQSQHRNVNAL